MPLAMNGMKMSCLMKEGEDGQIKISLRSIGNIPVNEISSKYFNGGGHKNAAGGEFIGTLEECILKYEEALMEYKPLLTSKTA
ncbi:MAG: DHHA1 domain-containing protein, partial [Bacteroidaceae bacterium]